MKKARTGALAGGLLLAVVACHRSTLPGGISDDEFRNLSVRLSERAGAFALSDNFLSNETHVAETARWLTPRGGIYIGVGPEQNFTYVARLRPAVAFIVDIRRDNLDLHLLYKAIFEISADRVEFVSRLFSRPRPAGLAADASVDDIFARYTTVPASGALREQTFVLVRERLTAAHRLPLAPPDVAAIESALRAFHDDGPEMHYWRSRPMDGEQQGPSYRRLMTMPDLGGERRSFLSSEDAFRVVKDLEARNLIVPVVGDFGGAKALRGIGDYARAHRDRIQAFYGSNVGVYLDTRQARAFCDTLASLPVSPGAWFIESDGMRPFSAKLKACASAHR